MYFRYLKPCFVRQPIRTPDAHLGVKGVTVFQDGVSTSALFTLKTTNHLHSPHITLLPYSLMTLQSDVA